VERATRCSLQRRGGRVLRRAFVEHVEEMVREQHRALWMTPGQREDSVDLAARPQPMRAEEGLGRRTPC
jgi:hypothetical protein